MDVQIGEGQERHRRHRGRHVQARALQRGPRGPRGGSGAIDDGATSGAEGATVPGGARPSGTVSAFRGCVKTILLVFSGVFWFGFLSWFGLFLCFFYRELSLKDERKKRMMVYFLFSFLLNFHPKTNK